MRQAIAALLFLVCLIVIGFSINGDAAECHGMDCPDYWTKPCPDAEHKEPPA